jgi:osmotically inducible lipoprotein OsmB
MKTTLALVAGVALLGLAACGTSPGDRAASGGLIGAGTGAAAGALMGNPLAGAVVGGAVGAGTGLLTSPDNVQLGRPAWR